MAGSIPPNPVGSRSDYVGGVGEPVTRRERKKEQTRRALTRAALTLFLERGFEATTVDDIAEAADFHRATFFRIFQSKEDVALGDINDRFKDAQTTLRAAQPTDDPWSVARAVLTEQATSFEDSDDELESAHVAVWTTDPALQQRFAAMMLDWERELARFFAAAWSTDPETDIACHAVATAMIGVTRSAMMTGRAGGRTVRQILDEGFDYLERGALGSPRG
jgi:AcrR family transcriptional regulator